MEFIQLSFFNFNARLIIGVEETAVATTTAGKRMISRLQMQKSTTNPT